MSSYRNYTPWSSRGSSYTTSSSDKAAASPSSVDHGSRFSTNYRQSCTTSSSYRPNSLAFTTSVRERAAAVEAETPKLQPVGKYTSRSYGADTVRRKSSPETTSDRNKSSGTPSYRRFASSSYVTSETPALRYGSSSRFGSQIARSPISEKSPTIFGISNNAMSIRDDNKITSETVKQPSTVLMVTRGTSPTLPPNSAYLRMRRAEMDKTSEKTVERSAITISTSSVEVQTEEKEIDLKNKENKYNTAAIRNVISVPSRFSASSSSSSYSPSSSSAYSPRYTPRSSNYIYTRPTDLPLKSASVGPTKTLVQDNLKTPDSPSAGEDIKTSKLEGKDRIGGFSYTKQTDLHSVSSLSKIPSSDNEEKTFSTLSGIPSPHKENVHDRSIKPDGANRNSSLGETTEITLSDTENINKSPLFLSRISSPDKSKLPPPAPKNDIKSVFLNKDFRKSILNMDLSSSSESSEVQKNINNNSDKIKSSSESTSFHKSPRSLMSSKSVPKLQYCKSYFKTSETQKTDSSYESNSEYSTSSESSASSEGESSDDEYEGTNSKPENGRIPCDISVPDNESIAKVSSADEVSKPFDKPPIPPSSPLVKKSKPCDIRTEEAKAVVARALAPITEKMKVKYVGSNVENSSDDICKIVKDADSDQQNNYRIKRIESGERAWWLESNTDIPSMQNIASDKSDKSVNKDSSKKSKDCQIKRIDSGERAWWMGSSGDENTSKKSKVSSQRRLSSDEPSKQDKSTSSGYKIKKIESGERAWWMVSSGDENTSTKSKISSQREVSNDEPSKQDKSTSLGYKIKKIESGERAWWMGSSGDENTSKKSKDSLQRHMSNDEPSKQDKNTSSGYKIKKIESGERAWWMGSSGDENSHTKLNCKESTANDKFVSFQKISGGKSFQEDKSTCSDYKIKRIESGERAWWMQDSSDDKPEKETCSNKLERDTSDKSDKCESSGHKINKVDSVRGTGSSSEETAVKKSNTKSSVKNGIDKSDYKIKKIQSGERAWWLGSSSDEHLNKKTNINKHVTKDKTNSTDNNTKKLGSRNSVGSVIRDSDDNTSSGVEAMPSDKSSEKEQSNFYPIQRIESGEPAWWLQGDENNRIPACSPEVSKSCIKQTESGEKAWRVDENNDGTTFVQPTASRRSKPRSSRLPLFIGCHTNIDDLLGTEAPPPAAFRTPNNSSSEEENEKEECLEVEADQVRIHDSTARTPVIKRRRGMIKLDDTALQLYKDGDYGAYLDLDASINEQQEEFENFQSSRKNSIVLRTQLSVRVHTIIEKLLTSEGRELRRALFSLKQIFQEDKDLVHEFVQNDGLSCLIKVGSDADQNYQNYILRALGQVMLYIDGMNGVIEHISTIQWLYSLVASKFRLVVKTALKLLLVFVEYVESNSVLLVKAIHTVDSAQGSTPWVNIIKLLKEYDAADTELLIYATSLINKTLSGLPDQDTYYDQVDALEEQGFEEIIRRYMSKQGTDLDLLRQFQIYEAVLHHEDGEEKGTPLKQLDETIKRALRHRKCLTATLNQVERRKSRRHSTGTSPNPLVINLNSHSIEPDVTNDGYCNTPEDAGVTPALRRRRERAERQRSFIREQREANLRASLSSTDQSGSEDGGATRNSVPGGLSFQNGVGNDDSAIQRENTVKDLTQKLTITLNSPIEEGGKLCRVGDMKGIISKAKEGLAKSQSRSEVLKSPSAEIPCPIRPPEIKKSETELHWEELVNTSNRELSLCDLDFTDLADDEDHDILAPAIGANGIPPPPPQIGVPPPAPAAPFAPPPLVNVQTRHSSPIRKNKKTVKLFWKEVRADPLVFAKLHTNNLIWDELAEVTVDTQKLEHLFESRAKDLITKKQQELNKNKEIIVLDPKRSNAINIGMTKLPPPRSIKAAILKMDATVMNREGIEKLLTMLPTEEERSKIQEAQATNPDLPLGNAEQFLLTLASISELPARLKLWAFKLDFEISEKEIAEPLMDLKQGMETLKSNTTFRAILSTLLSIGIFLNGTEVKGFQIDYLAKVPEVKDTVHKHSLLHHLCHMVMEKFPDSTDLYSEIGTITRASKIDFDELAANIQKMESECKASFDHLKIISKHDGATSNMKVKLSDFLADCAERIIVLTKVHRRIMNRYHKFCLWLGIPFHRVQANKPNELCRIISEFALEYRTTRERVLQQLEKKANHRERNKTRGKMITEVGKFRSQEDRADAELRQLLGSDTQEDTSLTGSLPWRRQRKENIGRTVLGTLGRSDGVNGNFTDADDEIIESLVKTATKAPTTRSAPRERKRTRHAERKSLRRTLRNGLSDEERKHLAAYIKSY